MYNTEQNDIFISYRNAHYNISLWFAQLTQVHLYLIFILLILSSLGFLYEALELDPGQYNDNNMRQVSGKAQFEVSSVGIWRHQSCLRCCLSQGWYLMTFFLLVRYKQENMVKIVVIGKLMNVLTDYGVYCM